MLGLKRFENVAVTIRHIKLVQKIKKNQSKKGKVAVRSATAPEMWPAVLAA